MRIEACILFDDNTSLRVKLNRPEKTFKLKYKVNNVKKNFPYNFKRENLILEKHLWFFNKKCIYYKHGNLEPLDHSFVPETYDSEKLNIFLESQLLKDIGNSTKNKGIEMSIGLVLGLAGILAIVLIAILG